MTTEKLLDTSNRHCYVYTVEGLQVAILGHIRINMLDRLRVTIKVAKGDLSIRHNLDLYNDTQVDILIRKTAEKLEIDSILAGEGLCSEGRCKALPTMPLLNLIPSVPCWSELMRK